MGGRAHGYKEFIMETKNTNNVNNESLDLNMEKSKQNEAWKKTQDTEKSKENEEPVMVQ